MSSVLGLKVTPKKAIVLPFILFDSIALTLSIKSFFLFSLDLMTDLTIDKFVLNKSHLIRINSHSYHSIWTIQLSNLKSIRFN